MTFETQGDGHILFHDDAKRDGSWPKAAASAVLFRGESVLLVERSSEPATGCWSLPGGVIGAGETAEDAARRETHEETGLYAHMEGLAGVYDVIDRDDNGNVVLHYPTAQGQVGEEWRIFDESTWCCFLYTFAEIDELYKGGAMVSSGTINSTADVAIPWTSFDLQGKRLPKSRTLVVKHTGAGGVYSYELFQVLFPGPPA